MNAPDPTPAADAGGGVGGVWRDVATLADLTAKKKLVVDLDGTPVLLLWHRDTPFAFANLCIHRDRELSKGVILNDKLICPGHQWAFALDTGYESIKQTCQPTYDVRVEGERLQVYSVARPAIEAQAEPDVEA